MIIGSPYTARDSRIGFSAGLKAALKLIKKKRVVLNEYNPLLFN
jgi:hypothetical protein